jgi:hypothetical protein
MISAGPSQLDPVQLAREFTDEMHEGYRYLVRAIGYRAKAFLDMLTMHGGVGAAQLLLQGRDASDGFTRLWEANMLEHSVEATVLKAVYEPLFNDEEREIARRRLELHDFDVEGFCAELVNDDWSRADVRSRDQLALTRSQPTNQL